MLPKLQHISDLMHYYMISPKDAYRKVFLFAIFSGITQEQAISPSKSSINC